MHSLIIQNENKMIVFSAWIIDCSEENKLDSKNNDKIKFQLKFSESWISDNSKISKIQDSAIQIRLLHNLLSEHQHWKKNYHHIYLFDSMGIKYSILNQL